MAFDVKSVCIFVLLVTVFQQVVAKDCSDIESIKDCSQCSACGGHWCTNPTDVQANQIVRCSKTWTEGWCDDDLTSKDVFLKVAEGSVSPTKLDQSITVGVPHRIPFTPSYEIKMKADTQQDFKYKTVCVNNNCYIEVLAGADFCEQTTPTFVNAEIVIKGISKAVMVSYRVSCSCHCSAEVVEDSSFCNKHGNYSCGVCTCKNKWVGEYCDKYCEDKRGDESEDPCIHPAKPNVKCSGNGVCGLCQECQCFSEGIGAQYFQPEHLCLDLCAYINYDYDECIGQTEFGLCPHHAGTYPLNVLPCNATLMEQRDYRNRSIWIKCMGNTGDNTIVEYSAMRTGNEIYIMTGACGGNEAAVIVGSGGSVKVPVIVCLVLAAAAAAAAAGYLVWRQRTPPPALSAQLDNFDAENCTGRNPLYKPPTSFFKNPTYGKL